MGFLFDLILFGLAGLGIYHLIYRYKDVERRARAATRNKSDPTNQLRFVSTASFSTKKLMNKSEFRVFKLVEDLVKECSSGHRVFAQTSMGEFIGSSNREAFASINSKRIDCFILGPYGDPIAAIEYQGSGHHLDNGAAARDAVKKEVLRRANVPYIEVLEVHTDEHIRSLVKAVLTQSS